ncbi:MAG: hypothetical protein ACK5MG_02930 [Bacteroidales bacterium]
MANLVGVSLVGTQYHETAGQAQGTAPTNISINTMMAVGRTAYGIMRLFVNHQQVTINNYIGCYLKK